MALAVALGNFLAGHAGANAVDRWGFDTIPPSYHSAVLHLVAELGSPEALLTGVLVSVTVCWWRGDRRQALACLGGAGTAVVLAELVLKPWVGRHVGSALSYPSGHTTGIAALVTVVAIVAPARRRLLAAAIGAVLTLAVAVAVVALGWHYPTDALGGAALGCGSVLLVSGALRLGVGRGRRAGAEAVAHRPGRVLGRSPSATSH